MLTSWPPRKSRHPGPGDREMLLAQGINPDENAFSREIIAMREE